MGYTTYFRTHKNGIPVAAWEKICADTRKLLANLPAHSTNAGGYHADNPLKIAFEDDEPNKVTMTASFPSADELGKTLVKIARMADERSGAVKFRINGACVLSASSTDTGNASATVKASITHSDDVPEIVMGFNSSYVLDALKVAGKNPVVLSLRDAQSAGVITVPSLPEYSYLLMPMRL